MREFVPPPRTYTGPGSITALADSIEGENVHVITDDGIVEAGVLDDVLDHLPVEPTVHTDVSANPTRETVLELATRVSDADYVVGVGGGSAMDATKAACTLPAFPDDVARTLEVSPETRVTKSDRATPFVLVPTTAGTGTETGYWAVISDHDRGEKRSIGHPSMLADVAVLDPECTESLPPKVTAATGFDVVTHAVESLVANGASTITIPYSRRAYALATASLRTAVLEGDDLAARTRMLEASYLAGVAMNNAGLGAVHAISHAIGGEYDLPHGHVNAVLLPTVVRENGNRSARVREQFASIVESTGPAHELLADQLRRLRRDVGLDELPAETPAEWAWDDISSFAVDNINMQTNPIQYTESEITDLCRDVFE
ncbi:iron-containing alcohol dehydrogenase [Natronolimnohabitans sp. A-GB9]|uniref:iron-containing alcohol dehydrogenase family protein n=1 Tax=Natronolimnohabitans sp. A-GB9 TaxID=3069757 RepID=UPI0027B09DC2|nr:iron-containing alcohol dehydrogenase [Natronolimnohabitans sp. A-GB9]MDQ2052223.1 iron-containing alcohol dehydrogenase [Natronolimnohabitans sp. A-GB9]